MEIDITHTRITKKAHKKTRMPDSQKSTHAHITHTKITKKAHEKTRMPDSQKSTHAHITHARRTKKRRPARSPFFKCKLSLFVCSHKGAPQRLPNKTQLGELVPCSYITYRRSLTATYDPHRYSTDQMYYQSPSLQWLQT